MDSTAFCKLEVSRGSPRAARFDAFVDRAIVVARRVRAVSVAARAARRAAVDGLAGAARARRRRRPLNEARARRSASRSPIVPTCSGSPPSNGPKPSGCRGRSRVFGDLPFMISADSPDVWARQHEFRFDATIGVPPDAFSETGQDWGLPPWRADVMAAERLRLDARARAPLRRSLRRLPHRSPRRPLSHVRPADRQVDRRRSSIPHEEPAQIALGETLIGILSGAETRPDVIAEDLGSIPPFVRESMARLDLPGLKVLRWERHWDRDGQPPIDPAEFPERSVATTGTHDIEPLAATPEGRDRRTARRDPALAAVGRLVPDADSASGRVRLDRSHQHAGGGRRDELDVAREMAGRHVAQSGGSRWSAPIS